MEIKITDAYAAFRNQGPQISKSQKKRCAKGLHIFKELPRVVTGQSISTSIWRCDCGVLMHTRKMDPNLIK